MSPGELCNVQATMKGSARTFDHLICVVTGGTQGVGEAVAKHFAKQGAAGIVICGRNVDRGNAVRQTLEDLGTPSRFVLANIDKEQDCCAVIEEAGEAFGRVDVLVNAAGTTLRTSILDFQSSDVDYIFAVNVRGPMILMREAIAIMRENGNGGSIVNVSSVVAKGGPPFLCAYSASKAALETLTRNAAYAVVRDQIRVNAIAPGEIDTPGQHAARKSFHREPEGWLARVEPEQPFGRIIKAAELARAIAFLAGPDSGLMTGAIVHFDQSVPGAGLSPVPPPNR